MKALAVVLAVTIGGVGLVALKVGVRNVDQLIEPLVHWVRYLGDSPSTSQGSPPLSITEPTVRPGVRESGDFDSTSFTHEVARGMGKSLSNQCAQIDWRDNVYQQLSNHEWLLELIAGSDAKSRLAEGIRRLVSEVLTLEAVESPLIEVGVDLQEQSIRLSVDTPCGSERFLVTELHLQSEYQVNYDNAETRDLPRTHLDSGDTGHP